METTFSFIGCANHNLDDKGRLALPGKFREELQKSERPTELVAYADSRDCLVILYPYEQWLQIETDIKNNENAGHRQALARDYGYNSERLTLDKAGRVLLSQKHRDTAGLEREVIVGGGIFKIEIWESSRFMAQRTKEESALLEALRNVKLSI